MRKVSLSTILSLGFLLMAGSAFAASATQNLTVMVTVSNTAKLEISPGTINFPDADPDTVPLISADSPVSVTAKAKTTAGAGVTLTAISDGDFLSGSDSIAISNLIWTSGSSGFVGGTMNSTTPQNVGSWTGPGTRNGTLNFQLANSWNRVPGSYQAIVTYTLTAP